MYVGFANVIRTMLCLYHAISNDHQLSPQNKVTVGRLTPSALRVNVISPSIGGEHFAVFANHSRVQCIEQ